MTVDSKAKGARAELKTRDELRKLTGLAWERVPSSGALNAVHKLKGDLYIPGEKNLYCVEVKHYADDQLTSKILTTSVSSTFEMWWEQTTRESTEVDKKPLLIFKHDRGKLLCAVDDTIIPSKNLPMRHFLIGHMNVYVMKLEDFIQHCHPEFIK